MRERDGTYLCRHCRGRGSDKMWFRYTSVDEGDLICSSCGRHVHVNGAGKIRGYMDYYGRDCAGYRCRECRSKNTREFPHRVCSVCGEEIPISSADAAYKFEQRYGMHRPYVCETCRRKQKYKNWDIRCRKCGEVKTLTTPAERAYWKYCDFNGKSYICEQCRRIDADAVGTKRRPVQIENTAVFDELRREFKRMLSQLVSSKYSDSAVHQFLISLGDYLKSRFVYDFDLDVVDGKIIGVCLRDVSLYGNIYVPLDDRRSVFGRRGVPS
jgi:hypothetical protein